MNISLIDFEKDIREILTKEHKGSYSLDRPDYFYTDPFIQALWVGYQLGFTQRLLQESNKEQKKVPLLCKAQEFMYSPNH
jgi:hypothetical protein